MRDSSGCGGWVESSHRRGAVGGGMAGCERGRHCHCRCHGGTDGCEGASLSLSSSTLMACSYLGLNVVACAWVVVESGGGGALGTTLQFVTKV